MLNRGESCSIKITQVLISNSYGVLLELRSKMVLIYKRTSYLLLVD